MRRIFHLLITTAFLYALAACAGLTSPPSPNAAIKGAYDSIDAYVQVVATSYVRGRITTGQAVKASDNAKKARDTVDAAAAALAACKPPTPCTGYINLMQGLQPALLEFERELRAQQGAKQ